MSVLPPPEKKAHVVAEMFSRIAPHYDAANHLMTGGLDLLWRRRAVRALGLARGSRVADLACGTGAFCRTLRAHGFHATGFDNSPGMLAHAHGADAFVEADILDLPLADGSVDAVTCGFALRNVVDIRRCFAEMARIVRPGGAVAILDLAGAQGPLAPLQRLYLGRIVPLMGVLFGDRHAYRYLPASTVYLPPASELVGQLRDAGFADVRLLRLGLGSVFLLTGTRV